MVGEMNGCPVQIVVQHVAGYVPPNYKQADIEGWKMRTINWQRYFQVGKKHVRLVQYEERIRVRKSHFHY